MTEYNYLPFNKTCVYTFPVEPENTYCRTGCIKTDKISSFFNSILYGCSKKFLTSRYDDDKIKQINDFKQDIFKIIKQTDEFTSYTKNISEMFINIISNIFESLNDDDYEEEEYNDVIEIVKKDVDINSIILNLISVDDFTRIVKKTIKKATDNSFNSFRDNIMLETMTFINYEELLDDVDDDKAKYIKKAICYLNDIILDKISSSINEPREPDAVNQTIIKTVSDYLEYNIYILDFKTKQILMTSDIIQPRNSIFVISFDDKYFEILGKCNQNNKIQREFSYDDLIVQEFNKTDSLERSNE